MSVDQRTRDALNLASLSLPANPKVLSIEVEDYIDADGVDALWVWVILDESTDAEQFSGDEVIELKSAIRENLLQRGITAFPYISLIKESERSEVANED